MLTKEERLEFRMSQDGIGGHHAAMILGTSEWGNILDAYNEIVSVLDATLTIDDMEDPTEDQRRGIEQEAIAISRYQEATGREGRRQPQTRRHKTHPFIIGHIDWQQFSEGNGKGTGFLEVWCPRISTMSKIKAYGLSESKKCQGQHYAGVYDYSWGSYGIYHGDVGLLHFDVDRHEEWIETVWLPGMTRFWEDHIIPRKPPELEEQMDAAKLPDIGGEVVLMDGETWDHAIYELREAYEMSRSIAEIKSARQDQVKQLMEAHHAEVAEGTGVRIYHRPAKPRRTWDSRALEKYIKEAGGDPEHFKKAGKPSRPFKPYDLETGKPL